MCECNICTKGIKLIEKLAEKEILRKYQIGFPGDICTNYHLDVKKRGSDPEYLKQQSIKATIELD